MARHRSLQECGSSKAVTVLVRGGNQMAWCPKTGAGESMSGTDGWMVTVLKLYFFSCFFVFLMIYSYSFTVCTLYLTSAVSRLDTLLV